MMGVVGTFEGGVKKGCRNADLLFAERPGICRKAVFTLGSLLKRTQALPAIFACLIFGAPEAKAQDAQYTLEDDDVKVSDGVITKYERAGDAPSAIVIPAELRGETITGIGEDAFRFYTHKTRKQKLTSVTLPEGIATIGVGAFYENGLRSIDLSLCTSLATIGVGAFYENGLRSIDLSLCTSLATIGVWAFYGNELTSVTLPEGITFIDGNAFEENPVESIKLPDAALEGFTDKWMDGKGVRHDLGSTINDFEIFYVRVSEPYTLTDADVTVEEGVLTDYTYKGGASRRSAIVIPAELRGETITGIGKDAFADKQLTSVVLPEGLTSVERSAFNINPALTNVILPATPGYVWEGNGSTYVEIDNDSFRGHRRSYQKIAKRYTIDYLFGSNPDNPVSYTIEELPIRLADPVAGTSNILGTFVGWHENGFTNDPVTEIPAGTTGGKVFYAKWVNNAPTGIALSGERTIAENEPAGTLIGILSATDPDDGDTHRYRLSGDNPDSFKVTDVDGAKQLQSNTGFDYEARSIYALTVKAEDTAGNAFSQDFTITIENANDPPILAPEARIENATIIKEKPYALAIPATNAIDIDGDELTVTVEGLPEGLTYADGRISGTPTQAAVGKHTITVTYSDPSGGSVSDDFVLTISAVLAAAPPPEDLIKVYPNPASARITIEMNHSAQGYMLTVTDVIGHTALVIKDLNALMTNNSLTFPVSQLRPGLYFLRFTGKGGARPTVRKIQIKRD